MTPDQIRYCAYVALHSKVLAVRLLQAGDNAEDLATLLLELLLARDDIRPAQATPQDAEDLLTLVAAGADPGWSHQRRYQPLSPDLALRVEPNEALLDLVKTSWVWRIAECLRDGELERAGTVATRFLVLRERIRALSPPARVSRQDGARLVSILCEFAAESGRSRQKPQQRGQLLYFPTDRRATRRRTLRGAGL